MIHDYTPLSALYSFYDEFIKGFALACSRGCSICCTVNVAATTIETDYVRDSLGDFLSPVMLEHLVECAQLPRYIPATTLNRNTWQIIRGEEVTVDSGQHSDGTCPLLDAQGLCTVYENRPFACRAMSSTTPCMTGGSADMEPFLVTVNLAMYQIIEHLDSIGGITGNFSGLLCSAIAPGSISSDDNKENSSTMPEIRNCPLPGFIVPPEDKLRFKSFLRRLQAFPCGSGTLGEWLPEEISVY